MIESRFLTDEASQLPKSYGLDDVVVLVVKDLPLGNSPFLPACTMPDPKTNQQTIYLREEMDEDVIIAGKQLMPEKMAFALKSERLFFTHTVLHEIAHIIFGHHPADCEGKINCDLIAGAWAFDEMRRSGQITG
jgi:hypothetical protein